MIVTQNWVQLFHTYTYGNQMHLDISKDFWINWLHQNAETVFNLMLDGFLKFILWNIKISKK